MTEAQMTAAKKRLRKLEQRAAKLQSQIDRIHDQWNETREKLDDHGHRIDYDFKDCLA